MKKELYIKNFKNFVEFDLYKNIDTLDFACNSFTLKRLKNILFNWNIIFFKSLYLRKNKMYISKLNLYKNRFFFNFSTIKHLNFFFKKNLNVLILEKNLNILNINLHGYSLNFNYLNRWKFSSSNELYENIYIIFYIKLICGLLINLLFFLLIKLFFLIRFNFIVLRLNYPLFIEKKCLNI